MALEKHNCRILSITNRDAVGHDAIGSMIREDRSELGFNYLRQKVVRAAWREKPPFG